MAFIHHACGCDVHYRFSSPPSRESLQELARRSCYRCEPVTDAERTPTEPPFPMDGTPKQVDWARDIRRSQLARVERHFAEWRRLIDQHRDAERKAVAQGKFRTAMEQCERLEQVWSASWWINHKDATAAELLKAAGEWEG